MSRNARITPEIEAIIRDELAHQLSQAGIGAMYIEHFGNVKDQHLNEGLVLGLKTLAAGLLGDRTILSDNG